MVRPYRAAPADFREIYIRMGWDGIEDHYRTNYRCVARWIEECGGDELRAARAAVANRPVGRWKRSKRYVQGRTLTAVNGRTSDDVGDGS
jgi:hypothetical protein